MPLETRLKVPVVLLTWPPAMALAAALCLLLPDLDMVAAVATWSSSAVAAGACPSRAQIVVREQAT